MNVEIDVSNLHGGGMDKQSYIIPPTRNGHVPGQLTKAHRKVFQDDD
jgi:hypothetical protein